MIYRPDVGSMKGASANVESVFSGAGGMAAKASTIGADLLGAYVFCHYNYLYPCLRPTLQEIVEAYQKLHGREAHESDCESSSGVRPSPDLPISQSPPAPMSAPASSHWQMRTRLPQEEEEAEEEEEEEEEEM